MSAAGHSAARATVTTEAPDAPKRLLILITIVAQDSELIKIRLIALALPGLAQGFSDAGKAALTRQLSDAVGRSDTPGVVAALDAQDSL